MRIDRHTLLLEKTGENVFEKGDMVFEAKAPARFKTEHVMAVAPDLEYPVWYSWLGALAWFGMPVLLRERVTVNWKTRKLTVLRWVWPFRALAHWLTLRHRQRALGHILVRSIQVDDREALLVPIPLLNFMGDAVVLTNLPVIQPGGCLRVVLKGDVQRSAPAITVCAVGFAVYGG